jgi:activating signal cointegrator 1
VKALSIHQPYASLIALGVKHFETRHWGTAYRGPLAIHATKKLEYPASRQFMRVLVNAGIEDVAALPLGCVIAITDLVGCWKTRSITHRISEVEALVGDFSHGRVAWELTNVRVLNPVPVRGQQGLWEWNHTQVLSEGESC